MSTLTMPVFGGGTALVLLGAGLFLRRLLRRAAPGQINNANRGKMLLGWMLLLLGIMALTGIDKVLEAWALTWLPDWAVSL